MNDEINRITTASDKKAQAADRRLIGVLALIIAILLVANLGSLMFIWWRVNETVQLKHGELMVKMATLEVQADEFAGKLTISPADVFAEVKRLNDKVGTLEAEILELKLKLDRAEP